MKALGRWAVFLLILFAAGGSGPAQAASSITANNNPKSILSATTPAAPSFNAPQNQGSTSLLLSWQDKSDNEDGFRVRSWIPSPYDNSRIWSDYSNQMGITTPGQTTSNLQSNGNQTGPSAIKTVLTFTLGQRSYQVDGVTRQMESAAVSLEGALCCRSNPWPSRWAPSWVGTR